MVKTVTAMGGAGGTLFCSQSFSVFNYTQIHALNRPSLPLTLPPLVHKFTTFSNQDSILAKTQYRLRLRVVTKAADSSQPSSAITLSDKAIVPDDEFSLAKVLCFWFNFFSFKRIEKKYAHLEGSDYGVICIFDQIAFFAEVSLYFRIIISTCS